MPNFIEIEETFCGRTYGRTFENQVIKSTQKSRPKNAQETDLKYKRCMREIAT